MCCCCAAWCAAKCACCACDCLKKLLCVDKEALAIMSDGKLKPLANLQIGDKIKTLDSAGNMIDTEVIMFAHVGNDQKIMYNIITWSGKSIRASANHLIPVASYKEYKYAKDVTEQDMINALDLDTKKMCLEQVRAIALEECTGYVAPITMSGDFLANGVLVSCYAEIESQSLAHAAFEPIRWWHSMMNSVAPEFLADTLKSEKQSEGIHWYPASLFIMAGSLIDMLAARKKETVETEESTGMIAGPEGEDHLLFLMA